MRGPGVIAVVSGAVGLLVLAAASSALWPSATANRLLARLDTKQELALVSLPAEAVPVGSDPSVGRLLARNPPGEEAALSNLIDARRYWRVPGSPQSVLAWIAAHPPAGGRAVGEGSYPAPHGHGTIFDARYNFRSQRGADYRSLTFELTMATGGGTAVRADGQAIWIMTRPPWERVPPAARAVTVTVAFAGTRERSSITLTSARKVQAVAELILRLPVVQPGSYSCGYFYAGAPSLTLVFRAAANAAPLARFATDDSDCGWLGASIRGRSDQTLWIANLPELIARLGGFMFCHGSQVRLQPGRIQSAGRFGLALMFRNVSSSVCSFYGHSHVRLRAADGRWLATHVSGPTQPPTVTTVAPGQSASVGVSWSSSCPRSRAASIQVTLPHISKPFAIGLRHVRYPVDPCGGQISVAGP
jgi:hypothetical protein